MILSKELLNYTSTEIEADTLRTRLASASNREAAEILGKNRRTVDRQINAIVARAASQGYDASANLPKILVFDIETAPMIAYLWSIWQHGTNIGALESNTYMLSWAAKWVGSDEVFCDSLFDNPDYTPGSEDDGRMLDKLWELLDDADFTVTHNGDGFDIKHVNTRFLLNNYPPPSPSKSIDTLKLVKRRFKFDSNKLEFLLTKLYGEGKEDAGGMATWIACMKGDKAAWDQMKFYNKGDVTKLERLYLDLRGWDHLHPSMATHGSVSGVHQCNACGSENVHAVEDKTVSTNASVFQLYRCDDCEHQMRGRTNLLSKKQRGSLLMNVK